MFYLLMEHSRLLKFLTEERFKKNMSEPSFNIAKDNTNPSISDEVPGKQEIREMADSYSEIYTDTLSPVISVVKKETTLTKGDLKVQKVTVEEDIASQEMEDEDSINSELQTTQTNEKITIFNETDFDSEEVQEDKNREEKKSRIPQRRFKQTVEKLKREKEQQIEVQTQNIRRSSIPKLVKKESSFKYESHSEPVSIEPLAKLEHEFDKIYEEIADDNQKDLDKILPVKIDDPEKIETKFEEIIHAYDDDEHNLTQTEKIRISKIPWRKKEDESRFSALADRVKNHNSAETSKLKDGGFKVSATTITTKRFSRSSSTEMENNQKVDVVKNIDIQNSSNKKVIKQSITTDTIEDVPVKKIDIIHSIRRELSIDDDNITKAEDIFIGQDITKQSSIRQNIRTGIPIKHDRINRSISKELNKRPPSLHDRDFVNKEVIKREELTDGRSKLFTREIKIKETPVKTEKFTRGISRTFSRDGKSVTVASKIKNIATEEARLIKIDTNTKENDNIKTDKEKHINTEIHETEINKESLKTENAKESIKVGIPVFTKITRSYSKGKVENVEISKTIEWKQADEVKTKGYVRSYSENKLNKTIVIDNKFSPTFKKEEFVKTRLNKENEFNNTADVQAIDIDNTTSKIVTDVNKTEKNNSNIIKTHRQTSENISLRTKQTENSNLSVQNKDRNKENVPILKGNVNRIISQISVKENVVKKEVNIDEELPKKKSVLSKIAMFEGKEPPEFSVIVKKTFVAKTPTRVTKENDHNSRNDTFTEKTQPKLNLNIDIHEAQNNVIVGVRNTPIIVDQIWKFQEQDIENSTTGEDITILPEIIDFTYDNDEGTQTTTTVVENANDDVSKTFNEPIETLPGHLDFVHIENQVEEPQALSARTYLGNDIASRPVEPITLPAKVDFITNESYDNIVKYSAEKVEVKNNAEEKTVKVGKLNLNLWKKQVEVNKQHIGKGKPSESPGHILPGKISFEENNRGIETPLILPGKIEIQQETSYIWPNKTDFTKDENADEAIEGQLKVPIILPETPLNEQIKPEFETQRSQIELPIILPNIIANKDETSLILHHRIDVEHDTSDTLAEQDFKTEENLFEIPKTLPSTIEINANENKVENPITFSNIKTAETPKILPEHIDFEIDSNKTDNPTPYSYVSFNDDQNFNTVQEIDREILSDPELVDNETNVTETRNPNIDTFKNKIYFNSYEKTIKKNEEFINDNIIKESNIQTSKGFNTKSDIEVKTSNSVEDLKRTESLAELDLGDLLKGQVKKMVYRIKSVEFDKYAGPKLGISVKEMPKKSSVLEKIALFEGRTATTKSERTEKPETLETTTVTLTNGTGAPLNKTESISEEVYLQKVEDLSTAKLHYGKMEMLYMKLSNDVQMPAIALGTALMDPRLTPHIVSAAIDLGYRAIDTAYIYGNEREVGQAIKTKIDDGTVRRENLYIMSKLWSTFHHPDLVETACRASLEALGLEYFDLYMIHNPMSFKEGGDPIPKIATVLQFSEYDYLDAWFAMEKLVTKGLVRSIGVSNFNSQQIQRILDKGRIRPVVNQVECHPYLSQQRLQNFCTERNITLSCFAVLGSKGTPSEYTSGVPAVIDDPLVQVMASGLNVTTAQLLVRYQIQSGRSVVVKASTASHLWGVLQALTFELEKHQIDALSALNRNKRIFTFKGFGDVHKNYPFRAPF